MERWRGGATVAILCRRQSCRTSPFPGWQQCCAVGRHAAPLPSQAGSNAVPSAVMPHPLRSLYLSLTHTLSLTHSLTHTHTHLLTHLLTHSHTHSPPTHSLLPNCLTHSFTHSLTLSLTHSYGWGSSMCVWMGGVHVCVDGGRCGDTMASCGDTNGEHVQSTCMCAVTHRWTYPQYAARILRSSHRNAGAPSGDTMASCGDTMASCGEFGVTLRTCSPDACSTPVISHSRLYLWSVNVPSTDRSVCIGRLSGVAYGQREARLAVWLHDAQGNYIRCGRVGGVVN